MEALGQAKIAAAEGVFPMSEGEVDEPFILTRRLARARTAAIRDYGRAHGATLNDLVLTALYRCLFRLLDLRPGGELTIPVMVDMRRYLADGDEFTASDQSLLDGGHAA